MSWNARSLNKTKQIFVCHLLRKYSPDIFTICETWLSEEAQNIDEYQVFQTDPRKSQGVAIYARTGIVTKIYKDNNPNILAIE